MYSVGQRDWSSHVFISHVVLKSGFTWYMYIDMYGESQILQEKPALNHLRYKSSNSPN